MVCKCQVLTRYWSLEGMEGMVLGYAMQTSESTEAKVDQESANTEERSKRKRERRRGKKVWWWEVLSLLLREGEQRN